MAICYPHGIAKSLIKYAKNNAIRFDLPVEFRIGDTENLPFENESFDAVISRYVLWTVADPRKAINEWIRILKPNGQLVIIDGNWYINRDSSLSRTLWSYLVIPLVLITEQRFPRLRDLDSDVKKKLWSTHEKRPDADIKLLNDLKFKDITIMGSVNRRTQTELEYLKSGYWGETFLVSAIK